MRLRASVTLLKAHFYITGEIGSFPFFFLGTKTYKEAKIQFNPIQFDFN